MDASLIEEVWGSAIFWLAAFEETGSSSPLPNMSSMDITCRYIVNSFCRGFSSEIQIITCLGQE